MTVTATPATGPADGRAVDVVRLARRRSTAQSLGVVVLLLLGFSVWAVIDQGAAPYLQRVIDGITNGVMYGLAALALVLVFKATKVINFGQGAMGLIGTYLVYAFASNWGIPLVLAILLGMVVSAVGATAIERTLIRPFDPSNHLPITIVTLALYLIINALVALIWGFDNLSFPSLFPRQVDDYIGIGGARFYYTSLGTILIAIAAVAALTLVLNKTRLGLRFRCMAGSVDSARLVGVNIGRTVQGSWAMAAAMGTLAGCLIAPTAVLDPTLMDKVLVYSFAAATLGGLDSIAGSLVGGVVVGLSISLITGYFPAVGGQFGLAVAFVVIIAVLQFKPTGLLGGRNLERV